MHYKFHLSFSLLSRFCKLTIHLVITDRRTIEVARFFKFCSFTSLIDVFRCFVQVSPDVKLPILYLIDSIVKNVDKSYKQLFAQNIVNMFCGVFEKVNLVSKVQKVNLKPLSFQVNEKVREKMYSLRQTWNDVFPQTKLYALDVKVNVMDNNWPITAKIVPKSVHVNPNFLKNKPPSARPQNNDPEDLLNQMKAKERELIELKQRKIELELMVTKKKIAESEREMRGSVVSQN